MLVVDDEVAILRAAEVVLHQAGYQALTAANVSEALLHFERHHDKLSAVVTDIMMPSGDGRQFITMLYAQSPRLPIIAMTGGTTRAFQGEVHKRGARAKLGKPFSPEELLSATAKALDETIP